ncbi:MAG: DUF433 domain-containing protein [Anaerolineae bacterium]|nr:DUF433 domain-containing protein [Anaerolineae bacterium]
MDNIQSINVIAINPKVRNGRAYIVGTTVTVADVAIAKIFHRQNEDGIADWYGLTLTQVHAALAYYYEHKTEIDELIRQQIRRSDELWEKRPGNERSLLSR